MRKYILRAQSQNIEQELAFEWVRVLAVHMFVFIFRSLRATLCRLCGGVCFRVNVFCTLSERVGVKCCLSLI